MSSNVQGSGTQQPVDFGSMPTRGSTATSDAVGRGMIDPNAKLQMLHGEQAVTLSQLAHRPTLIKPRVMNAHEQVAANNAAGTGLMDIGKTTRVASGQIATAMERIQTGKQTPEDQQQLQTYAKTLQGTAAYLKGLNGKGGDSRSLLGGFGFEKDHIDSLLQRQNDPAALTKGAKARHGQAYNQRKAELLEMGFNKNDVDIILSGGDSNLMRNEARQKKVIKAFRDNLEARRLAALGYDGQQIGNLLKLKQGSLNHTSADYQALKTALKNNVPDLNDRGIAVLLANGNQKKMKELSNLMKQMKADPTAMDKLTSLARDTQNVAQQPSKPFLAEHLKQLADVFMVLELLHQMGVEQRRFAREYRAAEYDAAKQEILKQANHIREAAKFTLAADVVMGGMSIAGGLGSMRAGAKGTTTQPKGTKGRSNKVDDVEVSTPGSQHKSAADADGNTTTASRKDKKKKAQRKQDIADQDQTLSQTKQQQKQTKKTEDEAQKAAEKQDAREAELQQQEAADRKVQKDNVTKQQDQAATDKSNIEADDAAAKKRDDQNATYGNQNKAMLIGQVSQAMGQLAAAPMKYMASEQQALQKESEAHQKTHENAAQAWSEWMQLQQDMVKTCQSKLEEISRIHFETLKSLSRG